MAIRRPSIGCPRQQGCRTSGYEQSVPRDHRRISFRDLPADEGERFFFGFHQAIEAFFNDHHAPIASCNLYE